jgi:hypothetical protein
MLITLTDPSITGTALTDVIGAGTPEDFDLEDWLAQSENNEGDLRALLNSLLHRHLRRLGLEFQKDPRRYFFNKGLAEDAPIRRPWTSARTSRTHSRLVAKHYAYGRLSFYRHQALDARFEHFGNRWAIGIYPGLHFSVDGVRQWMGDAARSYAIRARSEQYNDVYLNNVLFWANQISGGQSTFDLDVGIEPVTTVSGVPLTVDAGFCIRSAAPTNRKRS